MSKLTGLIVSAAVAVAALSVTAKAAEQVVIVDGDTLKLDGTTYRLWGVDTPEKGQQCEREGEYYDCGLYAQFALQAFIGDGDVRCEKVNTDRYRRVVAKCFVGNTDLGSWMVFNGFALEYKRYSKGYYTFEQDEAEKAERGVWAGDFTLPWVWRKERR
tara:strand:+ start:353 stop:829 length:477 start_codon:yes stop_codon:yes gene_type:complete